MNLLVGNIYSFYVEESSTHKDGRYYSILNNKNTDENIYFPFALKKGANYELKVDAIKNEKVFLDLNQQIKEAYTNESIYSFEVIGVLKKEVRESNISSDFLEVIDELKIKRTVKPFDWQIKNGSPTVDKVDCKVNVKGNNLFLEQIVEEGLKHPYFEIGEIYSFKVLDVKDIRESTIKILKVKGGDGQIYSVKAHFFQFPNNIIGETVNCIFNGIDHNGNILLEQDTDEFVTYRDIFGSSENKNVFFDNINTYAKKIYSKLIQDYSARQNLWVLSFCEGLKKVISKKLNEYDYQETTDLIKVLIQSEKWILQSGFLKTFSNDKREHSKFAAESTISSYSFLRDTILEIQSSDYEGVLKDYTDKINIEIAEQDYKKTIKRILQIIRYSPFEIVNSSYIIQLLKKLSSLNLLGSNEYSLFLGVVNSRKRELKRLVITDDLPNFKSSEQLNSTHIDEYAKILYLNAYLLYKVNNLIKARNTFAQYLRTLSYLIENQVFRNKILNISLIIIDLNSHEISKDRLKYFFNNEIEPPSIENIKKVAKQFIDSINANDSFIHDIENSIEQGTILETEIVSFHETFVKINYKNFSGIVPVDMICGFLESRYLEKSFPVRVLKFNKDARHFIAYHSNKDLIQDSKTTNYKWDEVFEFFKKENKYLTSNNFLSTLNIGQELVGLVKNVNDEIGVFINLGPKDALIPIELMSWSRSVKPSDEFTEGQVIRCKAKTIQNGKITISVEDYFADPWEKFGSELINKHWYIAKVVNIKEYGVFFDLAPKFFGLLHKSKIDFEEDLESIFSKGDTLCVYVSGYDQKKKQIKIEDYRNVSVEDFSDRNVTNLLREQDDAKKGLFVQDESEDYKDIVKQIAYNYRNLSFFNRNLEDKIIYLNWSRLFFSLGHASQSYLAYYYAKYYSSIYNFYNMEVGNENLNEVKELVEEIENDETISEVFPFVKNIINSLKVMSHYGDTSFSALNQLLETSFSNIISNTNRKLAKLVLSNNIIDIEDVPKDFYKKNKNTIVKYLRDGVIEIGSLSDIEDKDTPEAAKIIELIDSGESRNVEFKSSLYTPIMDSSTKEDIQRLKGLVKQFNKEGNQKAASAKEKEINDIIENVKPDDVKFSAMKAIVSFANTTGGVLLIGVSDDKRILGVNSEYKGESKSSNQDYYKKLFDDTVQRFISENIHACLEKVEILSVKGKDVMVVEVTESKNPVYIKENQSGKEISRFYIRRTASVIELDAKETIDYLSNKGQYLSNY